MFSQDETKEAVRASEHEYNLELERQHDVAKRDTYARHAETLLSYVDDMTHYSAQLQHDNRNLSEERAQLEDDNRNLIDELATQKQNYDHIVFISSAFCVGCALLLYMALEKVAEVSP